jgi:hypothetical protein
MSETKGYAFKHYQLPITILWNDPKEFFVKNMKILLEDIQKNGLERWTVKELKGEIKDIPDAEEEDECCPPPEEAVQQIARDKTFEI